MTTDINEIYDELSVGCHAFRDGFKTSYDYIPSKAAGIAFCILFGLTMVGHIVQLSWKRMWWCSVFAIGSAGMNLFFPPYYYQPLDSSTDSKDLSLPLNSGGFGLGRTYLEL